MGNTSLNNKDVGVRYVKKHGKWRGYLKFDYKLLCAQFKTEQEAFAYRQGLDRMYAELEEACNKARLEELVWVRDKLGLSSHSAEGLIAYPKVVEQIENLEARLKSKGAEHDT